MSTNSQHPSLTDWVQARLSGIYANETVEADLPTAINTSLAPSSEIMVNHSVVSRDKFVNDMTQFSNADPQANIEWKHVTELPKDADKPKEAGIVSGFMVVTRSLKFRIRAARAQTQSFITFSVKVDQDPTAQEDGGDHRRITQLFQTTVHKPVPLHLGKE